MKYYHIRIMGSTPTWMTGVLYLGLVAGMIFNRMTIVVGFGILIFNESAFGIKDKYEKG